jgi:hypothetical protein
MLCRRCGALKLQNSGGRFTTSSKVPVPSDHKSPKSPEVWLFDSGGEASRAAFATQIPSDPAALNNGGYFVSETCHETCKCGTATLKIVGGITPGQRVVEFSK